MASQDARPPVFSTLAVDAEAQTHREDGFGALLVVTTILESLHLGGTSGYQGIVVFAPDMNGRSPQRLRGVVTG